MSTDQKGIRVAVVGVTGLVGQVMLEVLKESHFPISEFIPVASSTSVGKEIQFKGKNYKIVSMHDAIQSVPDIALFSAGGTTSLEFAPQFAARGTYVIDNSSAWRMEPEVPLIVPEVNSHELRKDQYIIANPNCSTIQLVVVLHPIHEKYGIQRVVVSTYQSFTGTGMKAVRQYQAEKQSQEVPEPRAYHHPIFENCIPQCDTFLENGYTKEEMKIVHETKKIMGDYGLRITTTAVRVPVFGGHSESVNIELHNHFDIRDIRHLLAKSKAIKVLDRPSEFEYPTPLQAYQKNEVLVGRIRVDESVENGLNLWITADNLRKGAATNAVQIAKELRDRAWI